MIAPGGSRSIAISAFPARPNIFVAGDLASVQDAAGRPLPGIAPAAKQMGRYVGKLIAARVAGRENPPSPSSIAITAISPPSAARPRW